MSSISRLPICRRKENNRKKCGMRKYTRSRFNCNRRDFRRKRNYWYSKIRKNSWDSTSWELRSSKNWLLIISLKSHKKRRLQTDRTIKNQTWSNSDTKGISNNLKSEIKIFQKISNSSLLMVNLFQINLLILFLNKINHNYYFFFTP